MINQKYQARPAIVVVSEHDGQNGQDGQDGQEEEEEFDEE
jgi:hypothetical protein